MTMTANLQCKGSEDGTFISSLTMTSTVDVIQQFRDEFLDKANHSKKEPNQLRYYDQSTIDQIKAGVASRSDASTIRSDVSNFTPINDPIAFSRIVDDPIACSRAGDDNDVCSTVPHTLPSKISRFNENNDSSNAVPKSIPSKMPQESIKSQMEGKSLPSCEGKYKLPTSTAMDIEKELNSFLLKRKSEIPTKIDNSVPYDHAKSNISFLKFLQEKGDESTSVVTTKSNTNNRICKSTIDISGIGLMNSSLTTSDGSVGSSLHDKYALNKPSAESVRSVEEKAPMRKSSAESVSSAEEKAAEIKGKNRNAMVALGVVMEDKPITVNEYIVAKFRESVRLVGEKAAELEEQMMNATGIERRYAIEESKNKEGFDVITRERPVAVASQKERNENFVTKMRETVKLVAEKAAELEERILSATGIEEQLMKEETKNNEDFINSMKLVFDEVATVQEESIVIASDMCENASADVLNIINDACPQVGRKMEVIGIATHQQYIALCDKLDQMLESFYDMHGV